MIAEPQVRTDAIFHALLGVDEFAAERDDLAAAGVSPAAISTLYPYVISNLPAGIQKYIEGESNLLNIRQEQGESKAILLEDDLLWSEYPRAQRLAAIRYFRSFEPALMAVEDQILDSPRTNLLTKKRTLAEAQVRQFVRTLRQACWYVQHDTDSQAPAKHLSQVVSIYMPQLLGENS
jgi:hypothetical protein